MIHIDSLVERRWTEHMKRFLPITSDLSLIREKHRVLVQYLHLMPGETLTCSAALSKKDLRKVQALGDVDAKSFENELGQITWETRAESLYLRFVEEDRVLVELVLTAAERVRFEAALTELAPGS